MRADGVEFRGVACFRGAEWAGIERFSQITLLVGRNNSGKSQLINLLVQLARQGASKVEGEVKFSGTLEHDDLEDLFRKNISGGALPGPHWDRYGARLVGKRVSWIRKGREVSDISVVSSEAHDSRAIESLDRRGLLSNCPTPLTGKYVCRLAADRDLRPETASSDLKLDDNGAGATNIIRRYIASSSLPSDLIEVDLLNALNKIFGGDGEFDRINVQEHDTDGGAWEVFLSERTKGQQIPLSRSGSGLKTILLVLLNLLIVPKFDEFKDESPIFVFEELENNLHPSLLRRLISFVLDFVRDGEQMLFMTTHSPIVIDALSLLPDSQVIHVVHDGSSATTSSVASGADRRAVLQVLGTRPSDLFQANGVIWVEGPSDRIYLNAWISLMTDGELREGYHYQCAFFGGSLLANYEFADEETFSDLANLLRTNPNVALVADSDRSSQGASLKKRVKRIRDEVSKISKSFIWITGGREVENYLSGETLSRVFNKQGLPDPERYERFFPSSKDGGYCVKELRRKSMDKVDLAAACALEMKIDEMSNRLDWRNKMEGLVSAIRAWNS